MQITLTPLADEGVAVLPPDIVWNGIFGDFALSKGGDDGPAGGLKAANPLKTAVVLLLFSDARADVSDLRFEHRGDRRGWVGDGFDVDAAAGEAPLGSKLWLYRRAVLSDLTGMEMAAEAERALQPLVRQGAVVTIATKAVVDKVGGRVLLMVDLYGRDGTKAYTDQFDLLWSRADGGL
ncbi:phage GP46 family protein [Methylobacterium sp. E-041]|uniref:phage GP46 family protein n=1 Tax=Methylobacterium sp. E-041 TaxID=2836573 RepID=UPI001FBBC0E2|nr:phage GP46 family protein [Methylobacterium sp. E-041]MCJ2108022.1 phage GP46 family protein [Methylobacterium sp. E-041]